jgi:hypothetical protein
MDEGIDCLGNFGSNSAFLMSRRLTWTRQESEIIAQEYYSNQDLTMIPNDWLNPLLIRDWCRSLHRSDRQLIHNIHPYRFSVNLLRDFSKTTKFGFKVIPVEMNGNMIWVDPAGFPLAKSNKPSSWERDNLNYYDFILRSNEQVVIAKEYLETA